MLGKDDGRRFACCLWLVEERARKLLVDGLLRTMWFQWWLASCTLHPPAAKRSISVLPPGAAFHQATLAASLGGGKLKR